jgi:hypothetical protein
MMQQKTIASRNLEACTIIRAIVQAFFSRAFLAKWGVNEFLNKATQNRFPESRTHDMQATTSTKPICIDP